MVLYEIDLIYIIMNINENLKMRAKPLDKLVHKGVIRPTLNHWEHLLLMPNGPMRPLKCKITCVPKNKSILVM